jgi:hypothetical protein
LKPEAQFSNDGDATALLDNNHVRASMIGLKLLSKDFRRDDIDHFALSAPFEGLSS